MSQWDWDFNTPSHSEQGEVLARLAVLALAWLGSEVSDVGALGS